MGVPKLWGFVSKRRWLSDTRVFPTTSENGIDRVPLVFDGPSFAHWAWSQSSLRHGISLSPHPGEGIDLIEQMNIKNTQSPLENL
jgi:hypothetical protein